jgi:hypothetical protein
MKKGKEILNSGETIKFTTSLKESSQKPNRTEISVQKSINCINCQTNLYNKTGFWGNEAPQRWRSAEDDPDDDTWAHIELAGAEEEQSDARQKEALAAAQDMLKHDSPEVLELQPLVNQLKEAAAALKSTLVSKEPAGEERRQQLQGAYLAASNSLCHAAVALCNNNRWPQLFLAAYRASHPGRVNPLVDPMALRQAFEGLIDDA